MPNFPAVSHTLKLMNHWLIEVYQCGKPTHTVNGMQLPAHQDLYG